MSSSTVNIKDFRQEDFDCKKWINATLATEEENKEQYAHRVTLRLQMLTAELSRALGDATKSSRNIVAQSASEIENIERETKQLREDVSTYRAELVRIEENAGTVMSSLLELDERRTRLQEASDILGQVRRFDRTVESARYILDSDDPDVSSLTVEIESLSDILKSLTDVLDYEERKKTLEDMENSLESYLSTKLAAAFGNHEADSAKKYVALFKRLGRLPNLHQYYYETSLKAFLELWEISQGVDAITNLKEVDSFHDKMDQALRKEVPWIQAVFPEDWKPVTSVLIQKVLTNREPSYESILLTAFASAPSPDEVLIASRESLKSFGASIASIIYGNEEFEANIEVTRSIYGPLQDVRRAWPDRLRKTLRLKVVDHARHMIEQCERPRALADQLKSNTDRMMTAFRETLSQHEKMAAPELTVKVLNAIESALEDFCQLVRRCLDGNMVHNPEIEALNKAADREIILESAMSRSVPNFIDLLQVSATVGQMMFDMEELSEELEKVQIVMGATSNSKDFETAVEAPQVNFEDHVKIMNASVGRLNDSAHKAALITVVGPLEALLDSLPALPVWAQGNSSGGTSIAGELPRLNTSPQEYVTLLCEHILNLPQHLEGIMSMEEEEDGGAHLDLMKSMNSGHLKEQSGYSDVVDLDDLPGLWIVVLLDSIMDKYCEVILQINKLTARGRSQLIEDISYLDRILSGLDFNLSQNLSVIQECLRNPKSPEVPSDASQEVKDLAKQMQQRIVS